jgi:nitrilase
MGKIATIQMASGSHVQANLMEAAKLIKIAAEQGATMVVLPESFAMMGMRESDRVAIAEEDGAGVIQDWASQIANMYSIWLVAGTIPLKTKNPKKSTASALMFNDQGEQVARYDKIHLFDVTVEKNHETHLESATTQAGDKPVVVDTPLGKVGLAICYDLRFPEMFRQMVREGAQIFAIPSAFTKVTGEAHWKVLLRTRAIENLCYIAAANQGGYHVNRRETYGHSMLIDHWGAIQQVIKKGTGTISMSIDLNVLKATRESFPVLNHCKSWKL